ncbi:hypothetical protein LS482_13995 [Sinomicrobium kalidii]|uniref:hypothetical protein n=1 Tax=Sinomicrobium kalidii TaxID=2900738 RepID=UPI001E407BB8|nr:hypothetical protein [Sinomicrobium kalidii]UGU14804.1 hypothetical protein LS482_13995 [Sinomicrobium kalidii]
MNEEFEKLKTMFYITKSFFMSHPSFSQTYVFRDTNRKALNDYLGNLEAEDRPTQLYMQHLYAVNQQCDKDNVTLLEEELTGFKSLYKPQENLGFREAVKREEAIFNAHAGQFEKGSLNHDLRAYRPDPSYLPEGKLRFK